MRYISNTAAIACCAIVAMGMTGCNNNSSSSTTTTGTTTTTDLGGTTTTPTPGGATTTTDTCVPAAVKAAVTLDQNNTKTALSTALVAQEIGYMLSDGGMYYNTSSEKSAQEPKKVSKLASMLSAKIQTLQKNTADVKKSVSIPGEGSIEYGDNIACDLGGTYSFHGADSEGSEDDTQIYMEKLTLSFNECMMDATIENSRLYFFINMTLYTSIIGNSQYEAASNTYTFNGSLSLEYNDEYTYSSEYWNDDPQPSDEGYYYDSNSSGTSHWVTNGISVEYTENGMPKSHFTSTEELSVTFNGTYNDGYSTTYETDFNEGNYTNTHYYGTQQNTWSATFEGSESEQMFDVNTTVSLTACNFSSEGTSTYDYRYFTNYEEWGQVSDGETRAYTNSTKLSGYVVIQDGEQGFDLYADALTGSFTGNYSYLNDYDQGPEFNNTSELSLNGTVGSTLIGGSVVLDTQSPWLMSSEYPDNRASVQPAEIGYYSFYVDYSPYAGKTVLTGTNSAAVEFMHDEQNITYGTITVEGEEPVEYDSIEDMGIVQILNYYN